jgi:hypothetical protein
MQFKPAATRMTVLSRSIQSLEALHEVAKDVIEEIQAQPSPHPIESKYQTKRISLPKDTHTPEGDRLKGFKRVLKKEVSPKSPENDYNSKFSENEKF